MKNPFKTPDTLRVWREFEDEEDFQRYCKEHPDEHLSYFTFKNERKKSVKNAKPKTAWQWLKNVLKELLRE